MSKNTIGKSLIFVAAVAFVGLNANARPEYLKLFAADPLSRPELRGKCSVCHIAPEGGGPRNEFGKAFAAAGLEINADLRSRFPDKFLSAGDARKPLVTFVQGSDAEAIVEIDGKKYVVNTKAKTVTELDAAKPTDRVATAAPVEKAAQDEKRPGVYRQYDVRLVNLPTATPIPKGSLWTDFTHRFPFGDPVSGSSLLGLDSQAYPSFGFLYGITDRIHVGGYRSPGDLGRPIMFYAGASALSEQKGDPLSLMARVALEGRNNFKRDFTTSLEFTFARSITRHAQVYFVPAVSFGDRLINSDPDAEVPGETAFAMGVGAAVNIRPSVALMAEANYRLNEAARYHNGPIGIHRPVYGFGVQKVSASRRHAFSLTFSNGPGTTISQRSMTRGVYGADDSLGGLSIGFNLSRRLF